MRAEDACQALLADIRRVMARMSCWSNSRSGFGQPEGLCAKSFIRSWVKKRCANCPGHQATGQAYQQKIYARCGVRTAHITSGPSALLKALAFHANQKADQPLLEALKLLQRYAILQHPAILPRMKRCLWRTSSRDLARPGGQARSGGQGADQTD